MYCTILYHIVFYDQKVFGFMNILLLFVWPITYLSHIIHIHRLIPSWCKIVVMIWVVSFLMSPRLWWTLLSWRISLLTQGDWHLWWPRFLWWDACMSTRSLTVILWAYMHTIIEHIVDFIHVSRIIRKQHK